MSSRGAEDRQGVHVELQRPLATPPHVSKFHASDTLQLSELIDQSRWTRAQHILVPHLLLQVAGQVVLVVSPALLVCLLPVTLRTEVLEDLLSIAFGVSGDMVPLKGPAR